MASGTTASAAPKGKRKSSSRRRLVRRLIGLGIPLTVAAVAVVLAGWPSAIKVVGGELVVKQLQRCNQPA